VLAYGAVLVFVHLIGGARLALAPPSSETVRVASFTHTPRGLDSWDLIGHRVQGAALDSVRALLRAHQDTLLEWSRREARAGAQVVMCSEANFVVLKSDEQAALARIADVAREQGACVAMAMSVFTPGEGYYENELAVIGPSGEPLARYHKARPVPGDPERGADREIPVFQASFGRVAAAICFDMDFPDLIRRAGLQRADLILAPSSDWREIDPVHTRTALFRGIENGCSVVRQTNQGLSAAADWQGRVLARGDFFQARRHVMVAQVPTRGTSTIYSKVRDLFAYLCIGALAFFAAGAIASWKSTRSVAEPR